MSTTSDLSPPKKEAAPDRAASSGEEATQSSHTARLLATKVTKYASAEDNKGVGSRTIQQCVNFIKSDKAHRARILALRPLYAEAERLRLLYLAAREAQGHLSGKELDEATKAKRAAYLAAKALYDKPKAVLPMFTTSGVFEPQRGNDYLATYTGLLQADFDHLTEKHVSLQWLRARAERDPHVLFVAESPSGDGLKAFVFVSTGPEEHPEAFQAMRRYCAAILGVEPDDGVKALAQPCFLPSDPLVQVNQNVQPLDWRAWVEPVRPAARDTNEADEHGNGSKPDKAAVRSMLAAIPKRPDYPEWLKIVAAVGDALNGEDAAELLNEWSPEEKPGEYLEKLQSGMEKVHVGTLIHIARQNGWKGTLTDSGSPAEWFAAKFPALPAVHGEALLEEQNKEGTIVVKDICEPFLAATLSAEAVPNTPTVFITAEARFFTYQPEKGIYTEQRPHTLLANMSRLLLEAARAFPNCNTQALQFRFRDAASLSGVLTHARGLLAQSHGFFSTDLTEFIPCSNGMLRLRDRILLPFSPDYRRRNKLAVPYEPSAGCPLFLDTLMRPALGADDLELLQRWCGLSLVGENLAQRILILTGTAGGGKGTFIRVLRGIIGANNVGGLRTQLLGERFELGRFLGKTLLYGADVPENFLNHRGASVLKSLTGADPVTLEFKNSNETPDIVCRFNIAVTCNSRLTVHLEGDHDAWRRRLLIIPYLKPAPGRKIANLSEIILRDEASGVLNWMLAGLEKIHRDDWQIVVNEGQQKLVDDLLLESDSHGVFVREGLIRDGEAQITVADCYAAYVDFCTGRGWAALARNRFSAAIGDVIVRHFGIAQRHNIPDEHGKPQRGWKGFRVQPMDVEKAVPSVPTVQKSAFGTVGTPFPHSNGDNSESEEL